MITSNIIHRTFRIRWNKFVGTAFAIDVDQKEYIVTARHVINGFNGRNNISVFSNGKWIEVSMQLVEHGTNDIDISVLTTEKPLTPVELPVQPSSAGMTYGQGLYFLGFPYDLLGNVIFTTQGYPLPFVKRAILSCFAGDAYLLDGHNNPGFSGGPVVFAPPPATVPTNIGAVISGYQSVPEPIYVQDTATEYSYKYNTGIIVAYKIERALELIANNPIGARL